MTDTPLILVPSYRRAGEVATAERYPGVVLCVQEFEADEYRDAHPDLEIWSVPDTCRGNMAKVRNWMLDEGFQRSSRVVTMDDDVSYLARYYKTSPGVDETDRCRVCGSVQAGEIVHADECVYRGVEFWGQGPPPSYYRKLDMDDLLGFLAHGYDVAEEWGAHLWGVNVQADPKFYREYTPFTVLAPVLGPFSCHVRPAKEEDRIRYDERLGLNEDYDFVLEHWRRWRRVVRFNPYFYKCGHIDQPGGCASHRTMDAEKRQAEIMQSKWGRKLVRYNFDRSTNPVLHPPFRGV